MKDRVYTASYHNHCLRFVVDVKINTISIGRGVGKSIISKNSNIQLVFMDG